MKALHTFYTFINFSSNTPNTGTLQWARKHAEGFEMAIWLLVIAIIELAIGLSAAGMWADLFAPTSPVGIAADLRPDDAGRLADWQAVWQMYVGAQYL